MDTLRNAWKIPDLRRKLLFTLMMLIIFRIGSFIPVPGLNPDALKQMAKGGNLFGFMDILSGGAFAHATIFAMSIGPYINSSIIMQLLTVAIPRLEQLAKEGDEGRKILAQYIRYGTVALGFLQASGMYIGLRSSIKGMDPILAYFIITFSFTAGTAFLMWLGEQITEKGIGNGISMIIFGGIVSRGPAGVQGLIANYEAGAFISKGIVGMLVIALILVFFIAVIAAVVWVQQAERRIPVQYAKRVVGRKMYGGQSTHIPIKVNLAGVIPIIFAMSIVTFPGTIIGLVSPNPSNFLLIALSQPNHYLWSSILFALAQALLVLFFTFFYSLIQFNPIEIANNMKKNGGFIPGIRPGKPTSDYIAKVLNRITVFGGLFLALITIFPSILQMATGITSIWFGGTALLILVGVALDTVKQIESQMLMRHYKGFLE